MRGMVAFPAMVLPLFIGREKSVAALEAASNSDKMLLLVSQKDEGIDEIDDHDPPRFFSSRTDEQIQRFARESFEIVDFHIVALGEASFQSLTLTRR